jgi:UDP-N-acetylglucosamine 2-epimerase (non-hydrolysing)
MKLIDIIAGARPNFIKIYPIIKAIIKSKQKSGFSINYRLIHTGQHYDIKMSADFFKDLGIPAPDINFEVGSGTQTNQTASIMNNYEKVILGKRSHLCLVVGDVTSTMACAITAQKLHIPVAHVEAGIRSGDWTMPEEINRIVTDSITNYFFTTGKHANNNLISMGVETSKIFFVGNTMIDTLINQRNNLIRPKIWQRLKLINGNYIVLTLHRPSNVDSETNLKTLLTTIIEESRGLPILMPVHPRTLKVLKFFKNDLTGIHFLEPMGYLEFNYLVKNAKAVITDSGGITEETTVMGVPCMTLRNSTERPETVTTGTNEILGTDPVALKPSLERLFEGKWKKGRIPEKWDGKAGSRIIREIEKILA